MRTDFELVPLEQFPSIKRLSRFQAAIYAVMRAPEDHGLRFRLNDGEDPVKIDDSLRYAARRRRVKVSLVYEPGERAIYIRRRTSEDQEQEGTCSKAQRRRSSN